MGVNFVDYHIKLPYKGVQGSLWRHPFWQQFVLPKESLYQIRCLVSQLWLSFVVTDHTIITLLWVGSGLQDLTT